MLQVSQIKALAAKYKRTDMVYPYINSNGVKYLSLPTSVYSNAAVTATDPFTFTAPVDGYFQVDIFLRCYVDNYTGSTASKIRARLFSELLAANNDVLETELLDEWINVNPANENWDADNMNLDESGTSGSFSDMETLHGATIIKLSKGQKFKPYFILEGLSGTTNYVAYKGFAAIGCIGSH